MIAILKILTVLAVTALIVLGIVLFLRKTRRSVSAGTIVVSIVCGAVIMALSGVFATYTGVVYEPVRFTATGEKNSEASACEIIIVDYTVDGKQYNVQPPTEGKWFWFADAYMWRIESDTRQPEGTTRSIVTNVPVGRNRTINFSQDKWKGIVEVELDGQKRVVDTYREGENYSLPSSGAMVMLSFVVFALNVLLYELLMGGVLVLALAAFSGKYAKLAKYRYNIVYGIIAICSLLLSVPLFNEKSLWMDEMYQIQFSGCGNSLIDTLNVNETTPPLFRLIANIWYNIVPYGQGWLLLLSSLITAGAVYTMGLVGREMFDEKIGIVSAFLTAVSNTVISNAAIQFRGYCCLLLFSAIYLLYSIKRLRKGTDASFKDIIIMGLVTIPMTYTHYFGVFICIAMFCVDFIFWITKKVRFRVVLSYVIPFAAYIPWIIVFLKSNNISLPASWQKQPSMTAVFGLIEHLCSDNLFMIILFYVGLTAIVIRSICSIIGGKKEQLDKTMISAVPVMLCVILITMLFVYGKIRTQATLWAERYFIVLIPSAVTIMCGGVKEAANVLSHDRTRINAFIAAAMCIVIFPSAYVDISSNNYKEKNYYRECGNWIYEQINYLYNNDTVVFVTSQSAVSLGFHEYYMTKKGIRDDVNWVYKATLPSDYSTYFDQYNTIILCDYYSKNVIKKPIYTFIEKNYTLVNSNKELNLGVYVKNET